MSTQKAVDYSNLFASVDQTLDRKLPQLTLYFQLGKLLDRQPETGVVTAVAKYLAERYMDMRGFSPRSLRRMRAFYRTYKKQPCALLKAMRLGWTQNIVIFEADLTVAEREWYINATYRFGWSKLILTRKIAEKAHLNTTTQEPAVSTTPDIHTIPNSTMKPGAYFGSFRDSQDMADSCLRENIFSQTRKLDLKQVVYLWYTKTSSQRFAYHIFVRTTTPSKFSNLFSSKDCVNEIRNHSYKIIERGIDMDYLRDQRGNCISFMLKVKFPAYNELIECAYRNRGGIEGQRGALKSSTAIRIRRRMIDDIAKGTVLPPVVIGAAVGDIDFTEFVEMDDKQMIDWLTQHADDLSLIDGMQRTTAMVEAAKASDLAEYEIRLEFWLAKSVNNLIYRMLVLNSGQVPWDVRRQLETVFGSVLKQLKSENPDVSIFSVDEGRRRRNAKQYQSDNILELYLVFGSRKEKIDIKERLSDEFVRLDFLDLTASDESIHQFSEALSLMSKLDSCFCKVTQTEDNERFQNGLDIFSSQPACVGFIVSTAILMLGRPGSTQSKEKLLAKWENDRNSLMSLIEKMEIMPIEELSFFLALPTLSEKLNTKRSGKVGDFEREFFKSAFAALYEEGEHLSSFEICWNAY